MDRHVGDCSRRESGRPLGVDCSARASRTRKVAASGARLDAAQFAVDRVRRLSELGPQHVQRLLNAKGRPLRPRTVAIFDPSCARRFARPSDGGMVSRNVASLATPPRRETRSRSDPTKPTTFTEAIRGDGLEPLYLLALALDSARARSSGWPGDVDLASPHDGHRASCTSACRRAPGQLVPPSLESAGGRPARLRRRRLPAAAPATAASLAPGRLPLAAG